MTSEPIKTGGKVEPLRKARPCPECGKPSSRFLRNAKRLYRVVLTQFRTQNRFPLLLELL